MKMSISYIGLCLMVAVKNAPLNSYYSSPARYGIPLTGKKSFFTMATKDKPTIVKIWKKYIRLRYSFLYEVHFQKKNIEMILKSVLGFFLK